jgi:hypothetical protein
MVGVVSKAGNSIWADECVGVNVGVKVALGIVAV